MYVETSTTKVAKMLQERDGYISMTQGRRELITIGQKLFMRLLYPLPDTQEARAWSKNDVNTRRRVFKPKNKTPKRLEDIVKMCVL